MASVDGFFFFSESLCSPPSTDASAFGLSAGFSSLINSLWSIVTSSSSSSLSNDVSLVAGLFDIFVLLDASRTGDSSFPRDESTTILSGHAVVFGLCSLVPEAATDLSIALMREEDEFAPKPAPPPPVRRSLSLSSFTLAATWPSV